MARERMVTRTVSLTVVEVMCLDVEKAKVQVVSYELGGSFIDFDSILKSVKKLYETNTFKCVTVQSAEEKEVLYGMSEQKFIELAKVLPPRNKTEETEETETEQKQKQKKQNRK